jgi:N-acyl-D-amino-acid deacylase
MVSHPDTIVGLADGGAHCGLICDASVYTTMMSYWVRQRTRGPRLPIELVVAKMTSGPAALYGFDDRGVVAAGKKADLNVIDPERLGLRPPEVVYDLPAGSKRVIQRSEGYVATIVSGAITLSEGSHTGQRPGRLVRRSRPLLRSGGGR